MSKAKIYFLLCAVVIFFSASNKSYAQSGGSLYFCEDYKDAKEIGVSERFTTGWLTVMVRTDKPFGTEKVELLITQIADKNGNTISEKVIATVPFDIGADWNYAYFQDKSNLKFTSPGIYRVTLKDLKGIPFCSGEVEIISK